MSRSLLVCLVVGLVVALVTPNVLARGGRGGGGHRGGGHRGGHHGAHHGGQHRHFDHHYHHAHWSHNNRPFSHGWYGRHGGRWGYGWGGWAWGNPWVPATWGATTAWLGWQNPTPIPGNYGTVDDETDDAPNANAPAATPEDESDDYPQYSDEQKNAAAQLAKSRATDPSKDTQFLPLGVYTLAPEDAEEATAILQLAVAKDGALRGTYLNLLNDTDHQVRGAVDKKTQRAAFTIGPLGKIVFETSLHNLTQAAGGIAVHYENGESRHWTLARYAKEPTENDKDDDEQPTKSTTNKAG